jgi:hypothetical protein
MTLILDRLNNNFSGNEVTTPFKPRAKVICPRCEHVIFDGEAVLSRCVLVEDHGAKAKCKCKEWVRVPLVYAG